MIKHIVMWRLKDETDGRTKSENAKIIKDKLESLEKEMEQIKRIEVGIGAGLPGSSWDLVLYTEFGSQEDLDYYQTHPKHLEAGGFIKAVTKERAAVDYLF